MSKILVIDEVATALDWIMRCQDDGHEIRWFIPRDKPEWSNIGKGICDHVKDYNDWWKWADLIIFTGNTKYTESIDKWRKAGAMVIGTPERLSKWECNREFGQKVLKESGIKTADYKMFSKCDEAIAYVKKEMKRLVSKPDDGDKDMSYCAPSIEPVASMVYMLERWKKLNKLKGKFMLQEFIPGVEMAVGGWFGPGGFNRGWCENFEFKKLMNDDLGMATGEQGTVMRFVAKSKLADKVLAPLEDRLADEGYVGYIDVNCIIGEGGTPWPLEFTCRFGWPTFNIQQVLHQGDHAEWLLDLAEGSDARNWKMDAVALGVQMTMPDYPYSQFTKKEVSGVPLYGVTDKIEPYLSYQDMMMGEAPFEAGGKIVTKPCMVTAGDHIVVCSGTGKTVSAAKDKAYGILDKLSIPNSMMFRTDLGDRLEKQLPDLQDMGYATGMEF